MQLATFGYSVVGIKLLSIVDKNQFIKEEKTSKKISSLQQHLKFRLIYIYIYMKPGQKAPAKKKTLEKKSLIHRR